MSCAGMVVTVMDISQMPVVERRGKRTPRGLDSSRVTQLSLRKERRRRKVGLAEEEFGGKGEVEQFRTGEGKEGSEDADKEWGMGKMMNQGVKSDKQLSLIKEDPTVFAGWPCLLQPQVDQTCHFVKDVHFYSENHG